MRFNLLDQIVEVEPGRSIRTVKNLTLAEEYLADHFPTFPVMPGVLMLQTLLESGAWLLRLSDDFRYSVIVPREVRNVKYGTFLQPGSQLRVSVERTDSADGLPTFRGKGEADGKATVSARFTLACYNLAERDPALRPVDQKLIAHWRDLYGLLRGNRAERACRPVQEERAAP
jgi:3-hydroxyacyl-[acyl-carrier-protein] dehydratase